MKMFSRAGRLLWIALLVSLAFGIEKGSAQDDRQPEHLVSIFAHGEGKVAADSVVVTLLLRIENSELAVAVNSSLTKKEELKNAFRSIGIAEKDIVFDNYSSDSETGRFTGKVKSYTVTSPIRVTVSDERQFAQVSLAVDQDDELFYRGRSAKVSDESAPQLKAAEDSVANLNKKVKLYESAFGVKLQLVSFEEILPGQTVPPMAAMSPPGSKRYSSAGASYKLSEDSIDGLMASPSGDSFGELKAAVNVHGLFRIVREEENEGGNVAAKTAEVAEGER